MIQKTLQIATFGSDTEGILAGLCNFPIHKLVLLHYQEDTKMVGEFANNISSTLGVPIYLKVIRQTDIVRSAMEHVSDIIKENGSAYEQVLINVSAGDKMICCAALVCAFVNGIKAFGIDSEGNPKLMPIFKLTYNEVISDAKMNIMQAIDKAGGFVESLDQLSRRCILGKPLLSYHIQGNEESKGLVQLGLVDVERLERGRTKITLNTMGKMLISA